MSDVVGGGDYGSWNVSKTEGPLGLTCDPQLVGGYPCYASCAGPDPDTADCGYLAGSCDWTSCHDDVAYTEVRVMIVMMMIITRAANDPLVSQSRKLPLLTLSHLRQFSDTMLNRRLNTVSRCEIGMLT